MSMDSIYNGALTATAVQVSATPVDIGTLYVANGGAAGYLQVFYKLAASVTVGTTVADEVLFFAANANVPLYFGEHGWRTRGPLTIAMTTTATGSTTGAAHVTIWKAR